MFDDQWTTWLNIWLVLFMMFSLISKTIFDVCTLMEYQKGHDIVMKMQSPFTMQYNIFLDWGAIIMPRFISANKILFTQEKEIRTWKEQCFLLVWSSSSHLLFFSFFPFVILGENILCTSTKKRTMERKGKTITNPPITSSLEI